MCGKTEIRYVHEVAHPQHENLLVGCVCAEWMTGDRDGPKRAERRLRNLAARRDRWIAKGWKTSAKGNAFLNVGDHNVGILPDRFRADSWKWRIDGEFGRVLYPSPVEAKSALFDTLIRRGQLAARS